MITEPCLSPSADRLSARTLRQNAERAEADLISAAYFEFGKAMLAAATMERF
jgi:hypothetical protein